MKIRHYLITGASSDIGCTLIRRLQQKEENRILAVFRRSDFDPEQAGLDKRHHYLGDTDLSNEQDLKELKAEASRLFDQPFTVIHSVGDFWHHKPLIDTPLQEARKMIESHYFTLFALAHTLLPIQKNVGGGRLIAFSCNSVGQNYPDMAAVNAAKAAVDSLIKCIANEYSQYNIIANSLALSTIFTEKVEKSKQEKYFSGYITVDELADLVLDTVAQLSPLVNGNTIRLLKYSPYFYTEGYYQRNPTTAVNGDA